MTPEEFRELITTQADRSLLGPCLRDDLTPYVFDAESWGAFRTEIINALGVNENEIVIVGSARLGFSLKPNANLRAFHDKSDIDVAIVNQSMFDELWLNLLRVAYPRPPVTTKFGGWLELRRKELYTGWLSPLKIHFDRKIFGEKAGPILELRTRLFNAFKKASKHSIHKHEDISARLYRAWDYAEMYTLHGLAELRKSL